MRVIHYVIFFDFFQSCNLFTDRNSITVPNECTNTTQEIISYVYDKYYKKHNDSFVRCEISYIEENVMNEMKNLSDLTNDEYNAFVNNKVELTHEPKFIEKLQYKPTKGDIVYCIFDYSDYYDDSYTFTYSYSFVAGDNFDNQIKLLFKDVETKILAKDARNIHILKNPSCINCHYVIKGTYLSWKKY